MPGIVCPHARRHCASRASPMVGRVALRFVVGDIRMNRAPRLRSSSSNTSLHWWLAAGAVGPRSARLREDGQQGWQAQSWSCSRMQTAWRARRFQQSYGRQLPWPAVWDIAGHSRHSHRSGANLGRDMRTPGIKVPFGVFHDSPKLLI